MLNFKKKIPNSPLIDNQLNTAPRDYAIIIIAVFLLFRVLFNICIVDGSSMKPTFHDGNVIVMNHIRPEIQHGTIVTCRPHNFDEQIVKRVIGLPGDTIQIDYQNGIVYRNGEALCEDYILAPTYSDLGVEMPVYVPDGYYFVLGDNRNNSLDSRYPEIGLISEQEIQGSYLFTLLS